MNDRETIESWYVMCPHCEGGAYVFLVTRPAEGRTEWPLLRCRCGKAFTFLDSSALIYTKTCRLEPDEAARPLVLRQAVRLAAVTGMDDPYVLPYQNLC